MGITIGSQEFVETLKPSKFLKDHPVEKEAWKNNARKIGVIAIWAGMLTAGLFAGIFNGFAADLIAWIIAGFMGNVVTHGLYNTIITGAQLRLTQPGTETGKINTGKIDLRQQLLDVVSRKGVFLLNEEDFRMINSSRII